MLWLLLTSQASTRNDAKVTILQTLLTLTMRNGFHTTMDATELLETVS